MLDLLAHCGNGVRALGLLFLMCNLESLTRQEEQNEPVHDQDGPKDRDIKYFEPAAEEGNQDDPGSRLPELELRKAADKGPEFLVLLGRERADSTIFHVIIEGFVGGVELGLEESQEEVEQVDAKGICN